MQPTTTIQPHALLSRTDSAAGHSTKPAGRATTSAFSSYAFGPIQAGAGKDSNTGVKPVTGNFGAQQPSGIGSKAWIAQVQSTAGVKSHQ